MENVGRFCGLRQIRSRAGVSRVLGSTASCEQELLSLVCESWEAPSQGCLSLLQLMNQVSSRRTT